MFPVKLAGRRPEGPRATGMSAAYGPERRSGSDKHRWAWGWGGVGWAAGCQGKQKWYMYRGSVYLNRSFKDLINNYCWFFTFEKQEMVQVQRVCLLLDDIFNFLLPPFFRHANVAMHLHSKLDVSTKIKTANNFKRME